MRESINLPLHIYFFPCLQGGGAGAHGEMEREVRIFMQDERQRVHGRARSMHLKDICEKGESKLTFRLRREHRLRWERNERKRLFSTLVFTNVLLLVHTPMLAIYCIYTIEQESTIK